MGGSAVGAPVDTDGVGHSRRTTAVPSRSATNRTRRVGEGQGGACWRWRPWPVPNTTATTTAMRSGDERYIVYCASCHAVDDLVDGMKDEWGRGRRWLCSAAVTRTPMTLQPTEPTAVRPLRSATSIPPDTIWTNNNRPGVASALPDAGHTPKGTRSPVKGDPIGPTRRS